MARRFIVEEKDIKRKNDQEIEIMGNEVKHIQVLRHQVGDEIVVNEYICKIVQMYPHAILLKNIGKAKEEGVPGIDVTLYMAMLKNDKMDLVVQKTTELGVKKIVPFFSRNVVVKLDEKSRAKRIEKLQKIANEACKQCGRTDMVSIESFKELKEITNDFKKYDVCFVAYEQEKASLYTTIQKLKSFSNIKKIAIIVGAEGGFDQAEIEKLLENKNMNSISLGTRILRAETAAFDLLSIIMYEFDDKEER